uniref:Uncharacterized protein n=1 Tax=Molossus molossus TaxID=27622 RepID=A0A7J8EF12_MOLMO|nr:hypothetical protein HJG59_008906 [Molossus molossus]
MLNGPCRMTWSPRRQSPGYQLRRQSQLSSVPGSPMQGQTRRGVQFQRPCHLQQPLQLRLWSRGRPGQPLLTWLRPPHPWLKDPPLNLPWFLPQGKSCPRTIHQGQLQSCLLKGLNLTPQKHLLYLHSLTFFFYFSSFLCLYFLLGGIQFLLF